MKKAKVEVETYRIEDEYRHTIIDATRYKYGEKISQKVINLLKKANEQAFEEMPPGGRSLVSTLKFKFPKEKSGRSG